MSETRQRKYPEIRENITKDNINEVDKQNATSQLQNILSTSVKGASYLILLQLLSRLLTFILHQIVLRFTNPKTFGIAAVQLELLLLTILFLSREGFRCALLRGSGIENVQKQEKLQETENEILKQVENLPLANSPKGKAQKITNLSFIPIPFGIFTTFLACLFCIHTASEETFNSPYYVESVILYGVSAFLELIIEPLFITATNNLMFTLRVRSEGVAVVVRCVITFTLTILGAQKQEDNAENMYGILIFAVAQFAYALILFCGYIGYFYWNWNWRELWPRPVIVIQNDRPQKVWFDHDLSHLAFVFTWQSFLKHILTEGDKMLITWLSTPSDQGVYAFVANYGSLIVRILFQPLEETGRTLFSKLLSSIQPLERKQGDIDEKTIEAEETETQKDHLLTSLKILTTLIKFHILLGLLFIALGSNYTGVLIDILVGKKWSTDTPAPMALSSYCFYVPIMGINGITEAFVTGVATKETISSLNYWMIMFSIGFIGAGFVFMRILVAGAVGLVAANAFNLLMRILWSWRFIRNYYLSSVNLVTTADVSRLKSEIDHLLSLSNMTPNFVVCLSFIVAWFVTFWSDQVNGWATLDAKIKHIGVGSLCGLFVIIITYPFLTIFS
ncbi:4279_t:CDS:2 [Ambispora leptoticha]|uniref:Man(5)GlcNAc(2)-PP-dolichol translocation protein RFT1 n=1 Tax=Ambispora leptoticha TaxID=144679 RepID=A0A9N8ZJ55_9GLOM|nr:4279_t:CDS:2 [Ambispora leptoticha]